MISCFKGSGGLDIRTWKDREAGLIVCDNHLRFSANNVREKNKEEL